MLMSFILCCSLKPEHLKSESLQQIKTTYKLTRGDLAVNELVHIWTIEARALKLTFSTMMTNKTYQELEHILKVERDGLIKVL